MVSEKKCSWIILSVLLALSVSPAAAYEYLDYRDYPHWISQLETPVWAEDVLVDGSLAYLSIRTAGIVIVDIEDPYHPRQIGSLAGWTGTAGKLALSADVLFVSDGTGRVVHVVDVSTPSEPTELSLISTDVYPDGLAVDGSYLYVAVQSTGVEIFDISDSSAPQPVGTLSVSLAHNVRIFGDRLLVTDYTGALTLFDLSDPMVPFLISQTHFSNEMETYDVDMLGNLAYVVGALGTWIVDLTDATTPIEVGLIAQGSRSITIENQRAYLNPFQLKVYDLTNPLAPTLVSTLPAPSHGFSPIRKVVVSDGWVFTAADDAGLLIAEMAHQLSPPLVSNFSLPATAERVRLWNDYALVADHIEGLLVIDVSDPENPEQVASLASEDAQAVMTDGDLAYLADGGDGLKIVDLSDPLAPVQIGHLDTYSRTAKELALAGDFVYLAADLNGLMIIDVSDPTQPTLVQQVETESRAQDVCLGGEFAYVADKEGGLQVVDISDPTAAFVAATLNMVGWQESVVLDDDILFMGGTGTGLRAIDISDPLDPEIVGWLPFEARDLKLDGKILLAAGNEGVTVVDCFVPSALKSIGFLQTGEDCYTVASGDDFMLAAGDNLCIALNQQPPSSAVGNPPPGVSMWAQLTGAPNPFNPRIEVEFKLKERQQVELEVYDLAGRLVASLGSGVFSADTHRVSWDGNNLQGQAASAGCYFVMLSGQQQRQSLKVMLVR